MSKTMTITVGGEWKPGNQEQAEGRTLRTARQRRQRRRFNLLVWRARGEESLGTAPRPLSVWDPADSPRAEELDEEWWVDGKAHRREAKRLYDVALRHPGCPPQWGPGCPGWTEAELNRMARHPGRPVGGDSVAHIGPRCRCGDRALVGRGANGWERRGQDWFCPSCAQEVSTSDFLALRTEAAVAGDLEQVALCDRALAGDRAAVASCVEVIESAAAMVD